MDYSAKRVAVIGAGPGGLAATKFLLAEGASVTLFEKKSGAGGVWHPEYEADGSVRGPMYDSLEANVPHTLMTFSDFPWPETTPLYPSHRLVKQYLQSYASSLTACAMEGTELVVKYDTIVLDVRLNARRKSKKWQITTCSTLGGRDPSKDSIEQFDNVVVAVGNYHTPTFPAEPAISPEWTGGSNPWIVHSMFYPGPNPFVGKTVVIVGNGPSGWDISSQISTVARRIYVSTKTPSPTSAKNITNVGTVKAYDYATRSVAFMRGNKAKQVDHIIICTGYQYDYSFLRKTSGDSLIPTGAAVPDLFQHMVYRPEPSLAFIGIPKMTASFIVAEVQSSFIARFFTRSSGPRPTLPSDSQMANFEQVKSAEWNENMMQSQLPDRRKQLHNLGMNLDRAYVHTVSSMALDLGGNKAPPRWCTKLDMARELNKQVRAAFKAAGEDRYRITRFEQLGESVPDECEEVGFGG